MRRWIFTFLAILSAAITTWALYVTQETWRPPIVAEQQSPIDLATSNPEIEALESELVQIQRRLDELRSGARREPDPCFAPFTDAGFRIE